MNPDGLVNTLRDIVGKRGVKTAARRTAYYRTGFRSGRGDATAVVFPRTLVEQWRVLQACVDAGAAVIMQAAKTGLTEGSCPSGSGYGRPVVVINITRIKRIVLLDGGRQALVLPGTTLHELQEALAPIGRVPHSVIGSTSIGATVIGGIANNAGGALCKRGSSYTRLACYARVNGRGELEFINHLGIDGLGEQPDQVLGRLQSGDIPDDAVQDWDIPASDREYEQRIRQRDSNLPNRYNADPRRLFEVSGSAGKVAAFAVRVDTYPAPKRKQVFYLGTNDANRFVDLRGHVLDHFTQLPEMGEYMNRDTFKVAERYGKDVFLSIKYLGTKRLPGAYALKSAVEFWMNRLPLLPKYMPDRVLSYASRLFPQHIPKRLRGFRDRFEHYLLIDAADGAIDETRAYLAERWKDTDAGAFLELSPDEQSAALLHRFAAAGAAIRYHTMHDRRTEDVVALDVARLDHDHTWLNDPDPEVAEHLEALLVYGHFFCHVFHQDYVFKKGTDTARMKQLLLDALDEANAQYPAEHNVGHLYKAGETLEAFYKELDPTNTFNPGIGKTSKRAVKTAG
ncbi:MAG: D-lactate dehydrogenase [Planctomycetota bacterium]